MNWQKDLKREVKFGIALKGKTTFAIGGKAEIFAQPQDLGNLKSLVVMAKKRKVPIFILGAGSNILVSDKGVKGIVLKLNSPDFKKVSFKGNRAWAGSGVALPRLIQEARQSSLSGLEFLAGIPGSVGGALIMNAGAWGKSIGDLIEEVQVMDYNGKIRTLKRSGIKFSYRASNLDKYIILGAAFRLSKINKKNISRNLKNFLAKRRLTQDNTLPSAGCIFKNPASNSAGRLIDACGLKGRRAGGAVISERHANFILNKNNASSSDVLSLMDLARKEVKRKFNITLKPEIRLWV